MHALRTPRKAQTWGNHDSPTSFADLIYLLHTATCFHVSRGIFNKCVCDGDLQRERMGYTTMEQNAPAAIFVAGFLVVAAAGFLAVQGNSNVSTGLNGMISSEKNVQ